MRRLGHPSTTTRKPCGGGPLRRSVADMPSANAPGSCTNSHRPLPVGSRFAVVEIGLDTVSFAWRPQDPALWEFLSRAERARHLAVEDPFAMPAREDDGVVRRTRLIQQRRKDGRRIRSYLTEEHIAGVHWVFDLHHRLIYCEGRLACLLDDTKDAVRLRPPATLEHAAFLATFMLSQLGVHLDPDEAVIRRSDITGVVWFPNPKDGQDLQRVLRDHAGGSPTSRGTGPTVETVEWHGRRNRITFRSYDEGIHRGAHGAGELIRLERQLHLDKPHQLTIPQFLRSDLAGLWLDTFDRRTAAVPPLGSRTDAQGVIEQQIAAGLLSVETGTRLQGSIDRLERGGFALWGDGKLAQDHRRRLVRELARWGVETISPERRRGEAWHTAAHCRPAGGVLLVSDVSSALRAALSDLERSDGTAR
jgi:hypothetical protein